MKENGTYSKETVKIINNRRNLKIRDKDKNKIADANRLKKRFRNGKKRLNKIIEGAVRNGKGLRETGSI